MPPELSAKFESARAELRGERREVVVLFADVSGYTAMSESLDPEEVTLMMQGLMRELADAVYRYEGFVDKYIGDAIMALFGAPLAHENDPERAVLSALDMLQVVSRRKGETEHPISLRIGLNLGEVVAAHMGSESKLQYTVMGDAVNVASRLESKADPDSVLVSDAVYERIADRFETEEVPPLTVKGKSEPLRAHRVLRYRMADRTAVRSSTPFVGREEELAAMEAFFSQVAKGASRSLLVEADAGAGKTRLVQEALARTRVPIKRVVIGFSPIQLPGQVPLAVELFRNFLAGETDIEAARSRALSILGSDADKHLEGIEGLAQHGSGDQKGEGSGTDPKVARQNRWLALSAMISALAQERTVLIVLEDVHWTNDAADDFLSFLIPRLAGQRVGFVFNARPGSSWAWLPEDVERLRLRRLDEGDVRSILGELFERLRPGLRRELIRRSEGNPLYLEELARSLQESVEAVVTSVPGTLQGLLQSRIDRLSPPLQLLIEMAAVLGTRFATGLLARMYQLQAQPIGFEEALAALEGDGFVEETPDGDGQYRFRHALMQEVAYGRLLVRVRKVLHESAARLGEEFYADRQQVEAPFFAHHYWEAGLTIEAAPHLWRAGRSAAESYELFSAEQFLRRLCQVVETESGVLTMPEEQAQLCETFGKVLLHRSQLEEADTWFEKLVDLGHREERKEWFAGGLQHRGFVAWRRGKLDEAQSFFQQGLDQAPLPDELVSADLHNGLGLVFYYRGDVHASLDHHHKALNLRQRNQDHLGLSKSYMNIANVLDVLKGDLIGAEERYRQALEYAQQAGDRQMSASVLYNLGTVKLERGEWQNAWEQFERVQQLAEETGWTFAIYLSLMSMANCYISLGRIDAALRILQTCVEEGDAVFESLNRIGTRLAFFDAYMRALDDYSAKGVLEDARVVALQLEATEYNDWIRLDEGILLEVQEEHERAAKTFQEAHSLALDLNHPTFEKLALAHLHRAHARLGLAEPGPFPTEIGPRQALGLILQYLAADTNAIRAPSRDAAQSLGMAGDLAARLGDPALERAAFQRQAELWKELGDKTERRVSALRAIRAMRSLERQLPANLRGDFLHHPRNLALLELAEQPQESPSGM